ncbi:DUF397 domain-containing protein [Actinoalloteichus fjordicus]|uniref:DUF397 family protein n=1 Tax=Actinoalloteichus fjordicus TaxID=1612552 RepID=A0AAC9L9F0_9PSEU|nr:DUF397 domain-containing protein [Actinoalloteichus fjordicus]APU13381.1 putative DUF397 family protein [Actinoalloteichus fjordicus]
MMTATSDLSHARWRKSSRSNNGGGGCVEVAHALSLVGIRDTKNREGGTLAVAPAAFGSLVTAIKDGRLR